jgi:hypothetical protein
LLRAKLAAAVVAGAGETTLLAFIDALRRLVLAERAGLPPSALLAGRGGGAVAYSGFRVEVVGGGGAPLDMIAPPSKVSADGDDPPDE